MNKVIRYQKCGVIKRILAFIVDLFFIVISTLILIASCLAIFYSTPSYNHAISTENCLKEESGLYIDNLDIVTYLDSTELTTLEKAKEIDNVLTSFYLNDYFFANNKAFNSFIKRKIDCKYENKNMFVLIDDKVEFAINEIPDTEYYFFFKEEINKYSLYELRNNDMYVREAYFISLVTLIIIIFSFILSSLIFFFIVPIFSKRNRATLGMKIFKLGLISSSNYALTSKEFIFRFLFFFIIEYICGFLSFFLISIISLAYMLLSNKEEPFHDAIIDSKMIKLEGAKIFLNKFDALKNV